VRDECPMLGVAEVTTSWKLVALLSVLPTALAVGLPRDGRITAAGSSDAPRREHDVDRAEHVLDPVTVVLDASGVHQKAGFRLSPPFCCLPNRLLGDAGDLCRAARRPLAHLRGHFLEADGVALDEVAI